MTPPAVKYSDIRSTLKTGDVFTFHGNSALDWMIQIEEGQPYNHVGLVIRKGDDLYFWDAPGGGQHFPDPFKNDQPHGGARAAALDDVLGYYMQTEVSLFLRQVEPALSPERLAALDVFIELADGMPFPGQGIKLPFELGLGIGLAASFAFGNEFKSTHAGSFFCAHLAAETYMRMGLLPIAPYPANSYSPASFDSSDPKTLPLMNCTLSDVVQVIYDGPKYAAKSMGSAAEAATSATTA
jgi:hypothetical protein